MQKKGAIEFSMTTIIVVIIGVIILAIAIPWLTGTLRQAGELTDVAFDKAVESLRGNPTPDDPIMLSQDSFTLKRGERAALAVRFLNAEDSASFTLNFYEETTESQLFSLDETSKSIGSGATFDWKVLINIPNTQDVVGDHFIDVVVGGKRTPLVITVE